MADDKYLFLSNVSGIGSIGSCIGAYLTQSNIAWAIGIIAGIYSIYCSYLTHKEKKLSIKYLKTENEKWVQKKLLGTLKKDLNEKPQNP